MADYSHEDEHFGQRLPPLRIYLKRVLDKYPEGGQILKELLQNADDAKARNVVFLYDRSEHPAGKLWLDTLREFQGPALLAYNDASFTKEDWKSIQHIEQSCKRDDPTKVGRFGLGFISVYHLTDMPCILSGDQIGFLDPLEEHFKYDPLTKKWFEGERGKKWKLSPQLLNQFPDQFYPFINELFKCSTTDFEKGRFQGTIFRFPLRRKPSEISKSVFHDRHRVLELFRSFESDAELCLLFLKNVESIALYERNQSHERSRLIFKVQIRHEDRQQVRTNSAMFLSQIQKQDFHTVNCMHIERESGPQGAVSVSRYITVNMNKSTSSSDLQKLVKDPELNFVPWMGISFQISSSTEELEPQNGRVFCFLPLPESEQSGLPVHVHGYFGLSDNRRSIKWPDQESQYDKTAHWNQLLVTEVLPEVYATLILDAIAKSQDPKNPTQPGDVYKGWPHIQSVKRAWSDGVRKFLRLLADEAIVFANHKGGCWMKLADVYIDTKHNHLIAKVLSRKGCPVAQLPDHIVASFEWAGLRYKVVTPAVVREYIRRDPLKFLTRGEKLELLKYVTSDTISDLTNLHLLPLQNGKFISFGKAGPRVFIATSANPSALIPNGKRRFAASDLPDTLVKHSMVESYTQLKVLQISDVHPLLEEMLPNKWKSSPAAIEVLPWTPGANHHPSAEWVTVMWEWLCKHCMDLPLHTFRDIPLIPMPHSRIAKLKENGMIFCKQLNHPSSASLPESICSLLESVGAVVIRHSLPSCITGHPHLTSYIKAPNSEGVMTILGTFSHNKARICDCVAKMTSRGKDELRVLLAKSALAYTPQQKDILAKIPFFRTSSGHISAQKCVAAVPEHYFEIPVKTLRDGSKYIVLRDTSDNLVLSLNVSKTSDRELLAKSILPAVADTFYSANESLEIMTWVLSRPQFDDLIKGLKFIPCQPAVDGPLSSPKDLFEPTHLLKKLLRGKHVFPTGEYAEDKLLKFLKRVGLKKQSDIMAADLLDCAVEISSTQIVSQSDVKRGSILLDHLNHYPSLLFDQVHYRTAVKPLHEHLEGLQWVPCSISPPEHYPVSAGWMGNPTTLYSPRDVGLIQSAPLLGSTLPLVKLLDIDKELLRAFGWSEVLDANDHRQVELVILHLKNVANTFQSSQETYAVPHTVSMIYRFLSEASDALLRHLFETHMDDSQPWVWHGIGFTTPDKIALKIGTCGVSLVPFLHIVPEDIKQYSSFLSRMGVQQTFQERELVRVLHSVKEKHQINLAASNTDYQTDLNLVCNILRYIVDVGDPDTQASNILVPCRVPRCMRQLKMVPASECLYVDEERLAGQLFNETSQGEFDKPVIHESVSNDLAQRLGLQPLSHFIAPVDEVEYDMAGPHETPVNAIRRNLDMYKSGVDIFKELIQNADDAGATEVKFLLDWRRNEQTAHNLMSEGMKACHGPALWVYNDAQFSRQDFINICSIAAQSKRHQLEKIGRFGLGFTSVYHLTDIPSVVSGPYILICDPRMIHLGKRIKPGQPGIKLDLTNECHRRTLQIYPNQFQPYSGIFGCNLEASKGFDHTLFRLPLRTEIEADPQQPNQLSNQVCDSKKSIEPLMKSLKKSADALLLFTQNVLHVSVQELVSDISSIENVMSVTVERILQMPRSIHANSDVQTERNLLKATAACMENEDTSLPVPETTMIVKVTWEGQTSGMKKDWLYITSSCMARDKVLDLALTSDGCQAGVLPCGGVAAQLLDTEGNCLKPCPIKGSAFSYLPLNVSSDLPFHVNGNFLLQPNRRQLWSKSSSGAEEFEARWNSCLMESVLLRAFMNLLQDLQQLHEQNTVDAHNLQSLWPRRSLCKQDFLPLVDAYYRTIGRKDQAPAVIFSQNQWLSVHECFFTDWNPTDPMALRDSMKAQLAVHQSPKRWVELHKDVVDSIAKAGANTSFDDNTYSVKRFLEEVFFPTLSDCKPIDPDHQKDIILYMLDLRLGERKVVDYDQKLKTTKCIPVSPRGDLLVCPGQLVNPFTPVGYLFNDDDCRFPYGDGYRNKARLLSLTQLGMASDDLPWEDICERAESMMYGDQFEQRSTMLLKLIDMKLKSNDYPTPEQQRQIQEAAFLPVLKRPDGYPARWYSCDNELLSAVELFESRHRDLLGSVQPLLDEERLGSEAMSQRVKDFLGIQHKEVAVSDVIQQLTILIEEAAGVMQQTSMVTTIYRFLQDAVCDVSWGLLRAFAKQHETVKEKHRAAVDKLCALKFVLCEGEFRDCKQLAFNYSGQSGPYLFRVPATLTQFGSLLKICGVRDTFEVSDYLHTLQLLKRKYKSESLNEVDLKTARAMMQEIVSCLASSQSGTPECLRDADVFLPDVCCTLRTPSELTFDDMNWDGSSSEGVVYTHPDISYRVAKVFGIATQRERQLETCSSFGGFESDFGQHEELTDRLSNILRSYPDVSDVFKELLQNADDAGCTEIHFVYDPRSHQTKKIISDSWAEVQKLPSLCVFNDRAFTEADIRGIQKVGVGGKRDDITTTGKFGIGFNSVYHLTDCPSFLSKSDTLCVFDPLLKYIPGIQNTSPGKRFSTGEPFRQKFPDMLQGYLEDISDFTGKEGTMFRFPLRQKPSVISGNVFTQSEVHKLLDGFQQVSQEVLLFLNNIKTITISCIDKHTGKLDKKYSIAAELSNGDQKLRAKLSEHLKLFNDNVCETVPSMSGVYSLETCDSAGVKQSWLISQMLGFEDLTLDGAALSSAACLKKPLPLGAVAALIKASGKEKPPNQQYKAFCFLPLPVYTKLPVHINGTFELDSARRDLQKGDAYAKTQGSGEDGLILRWNRLLVENVIAPAYAKLIEHAGKKMLGETVLSESWQDHLEFYDELFPKDLEAMRGEWHLLAKATLCYIGQKNMQVLPVVNPIVQSISWHHPNSDTSLAFFDNLNSVDDPNLVGEAATSVSRPSKILHSILLRVDFHLLGSSQELCWAFQACDVKANFVSPEAVVRHLSLESAVTHSLPAPLKKTVFEDVNTLRTLFKYCLEGVRNPVELIGLPLQLTNDETLDLFTTHSQDRLYVTSHWQVLPNLGNRFLHKNLVTLCTDWFEKNKTSEEAYTSGIFRKFTISELGQHLDGHLPKEWRGCDRHVEWEPKREGHPDESWLKHLWKFICSQTSDDKSQLSLDAIKNWPIFPTTSGNLVPPSLSKTVLYLHALGEIGFGLNVATAFRKLGLPEVAWKRMCHVIDTQPPPQDLTQVLEANLSLPTAHGDIIRVITFMPHIGGAIHTLSCTECNTLLHYFQEGYDRKMLTLQNIQTIKQLPIFKLQGENKTVDIQHGKHYHTVEGCQVLGDEADIWMNHMKCVFLESRPTLNLIYEGLGISPITHAGIYLKYVLPSFSLLSQNARLKHIENIRDTVLPGASREEQESILQHLTRTPFILDQTMTLQTADYFFDPANVVFKAMVDPCRLLPKDVTPLMRNFLGKIGLHTHVTQDDFLRFANQIEARAKQLRDEDQLKTLCNNSNLLKNELDSNKDLHDQHFLQMISTVKFIPSAPLKSEHLDICPACSRSDGQKPYLLPFVAYRRSVPWRYLELVWSVCTVLPHWAMPTNKEIQKDVTVHDCLGIVTEEREILEKVLSHTKLVCGQMEKKNAIHKKDTLSTNVRKTAKGVMDKILGYLKSTPFKYRKQIECCLQHTPICMVDDGRVFVRANQLVFDMDVVSANKLRPYLYKAPRELGSFDAILELLGAQKSCSFDQLAGVLSAIKGDCADSADKSLLPREQKTVECAVKNLFTVLLRQKEKCELSVCELYLPSSKYVLRSTSDLYYADPHLMEQLTQASLKKEFMLPLKDCGFHCKNEASLIRYLPEKLRPKFLADEMQEKLCDTIEDCRDGRHCPHLTHIQHMIASEEMTRVLLRLYQHQLKENEPRQDDKKRIEEMQSFRNLSCKTELKLGVYNAQGKKIAEQRHSRKSFFDKNTGFLYLEHICPQQTHRSPIFLQIAESCNDILGRLFDDKHVAFLQSALDCPTPFEMNDVLSKFHNIPEYDEEIFGFQQQKHPRGTLIPLDIRHFLDDDPYNHFFKEEIVGYKTNLDELPSPASGSATVSTGAETSRPSSVETTEVIYAMIVDQVGKDQDAINLSRQYIIDIGQQEHITVSVTTLYKFLRPKDKHGTASVEESLPEDPQRDREQIERELREVFSLPEELQKTAIHRLYRKWHPDKNPNQQRRTNEAFKFLKQEIGRHDAGGQYSQRYSRWESEINKDREEARLYQERYNRSRRRGRKNQSRGSFVPFSFSREAPDPRSARLWFQQAKEHLKAAEQTSQLGSAPIQWIAFQIHQAAEVALKAAQYSLTGHPDTNSNSLSGLASAICQHRHVSSSELIDVAENLNCLDCQFDKPRYPQKWSAQTSGQVYYGFSTEEAFKTCSKLLNLVQDLIGIKEFKTASVLQS